MSTDSAPWIAPLQADEGPRRALVLSGGGMRVCYQAGVLQAFAEAELRFTLLDATSGGALNLAMLLSGLTPEAMQARWRSLQFRRTLSLMPLASYLSRKDCVRAGWFRCLS